AAVAMAPPAASRPAPPPRSGKVLSVPVHGSSPPPEPPEAPLPPDASLPPELASPPAPDAAPAAAASFAPSWEPAFEPVASASAFFPLDSAPALAPVPSAELSSSEPLPSAPSASASFGGSVGSGSDPPPPLITWTTVGRASAATPLSTSVSST